VSVKTAQVWERERGLPVRRLPGGRRVSVPVVALEAWKASAGPSPAPVSWWIVHRWRLVVAGLVLATLGVVSVVLVGRPGRPVSFRTGRDTLVVLDGRGRAVWRHVFPTPMDPGLGAKNVWFGASILAEALEVVLLLTQLMQRARDGHRS
jgi:hypothetical protein